MFNIYIYNFHHKRPFLLPNFIYCNLEPPGCPKPLKELNNGEVITDDNCLPDNLETYTARFVSEGCKITYSCNANFKFIGTKSKRNEIWRCISGQWNKNKNVECKHVALKFKTHLITLN